MVSLPETITDVLMDKRNNKKKLLIEKLVLENDLSPKALKVGIILCLEKLHFNKSVVLGGLKKSEDDLAQSEVSGLNKTVKQLNSYGLSITKPQLSNSLKQLSACGAFIKGYRLPKGRKFDDKTKRVVLKLNEDYIADFKL